jgi:hypothetical protein
MSNIEALLNIFANGTEIFGISLGMGLLIGALSILFLKKWSTAAKLAAAGVPVLLFALATPVVINWVVASIRDFNFPAHIESPLLWFTTAVCFLVALAFFLIGWLLPTIVAFRRHKRNRVVILVANILLSFVPFGWSIALFMSFMDDRETVAA